MCRRGHKVAVGGRSRNKMAEIGRSDKIADSEVQYGGKWRGNEIAEGRGEWQNGSR